MAYLTAANVVVTLNPEDIDRSPDGRIGIRTFPTVAYGNGVLQYPALGIPMPAIGKFGFNFAIKRAYIEQPANGFIYHFDRTNHKLRIFLGAARDAITAVFTGNAVTPVFTGNAANTANVSAGTPAGNVASPVFTGDAMANLTPAGNVSAPAFTGDEFAPGTPAGNVAAPADHSHDLVIVAGTEVDGVGVNGTKLVAANAANIPGGVAANGGVANAAIAAGAFTGDALANKTPTGNVAAPTFTGTEYAPGTPAGNVSAPAFTGDVLAVHLHGFTPAGSIGAITPAGTIAITGGGAVAEAALAEMDDGVAPAATTLYMEMVGK